MSDNPRPKNMNETVLRDALQRKQWTPTAVILIAILTLLTGLWLAFQEAHMIVQIYANAHGPVIWSTAVQVKTAGQFLLSIIACCSAIGLLIGSRLGWVLTVLFYFVRLSRETLTPIATALLYQPIHNEGVAADVDGTGILLRTAIFTVILYFLLRGNVLDYFELQSMNKVGAVTALFLTGLLYEGFYRFLLYVCTDPVFGADEAF